METMNIDGYGIAVTWDGSTLRAKGKNKMFHFALLGQNDVDINDHIQEDQSAAENVQSLRNARKEAMDLPEELVLNRDEFTVTKFKTANVAFNGVMILRTGDGKKYQLHFRRKHNAGFQELAQALGAA